MSLVGKTATKTARVGKIDSLVQNFPEREREHLLAHSPAHGAPCVVQQPPKATNVFLCAVNTFFVRVNTLHSKGT